MVLDPNLLHTLLNTFLLDIDQQGDALIDALLLLERRGPAQAAIDARTEAYTTTMRSSHNLKGGARGLGLNDVTDICHVMETHLVRLRDDGASPDAAFVDHCRAVLAQIRRAVADRAEGKPPSADPAGASTVPASGISTPPAAAAPSRPDVHDAPEAINRSAELGPDLLRELYAIMLVDIVEQGEIIIDGLLLLEQNTATRDTRARTYVTIMRATHSLKGAAGSMGLTDVAGICHVMETRFLGLRDTGAAPDASFVDRCRTAVAQMRQVIGDRSRGRATSVDLPALGAALAMEPPPLAPATAAAPANVTPATPNRPDAAPAPDAQLLNLFLLDLDQQGEHLIDALLLLERHDAAPDARLNAYSSIMRVAHNLKGGASGMGLHDIAALCHAMETQLTRLRDTGGSPDARFVDCCRTVISGIRQAVADQAEGRKVSVDLAALATAIDTDFDSAPAAPDKSAPPRRAPPPAPPVGAATARAGAAPARNATQTIPVRLDKLDRISALADDLVVSRSGMSGNHALARQLRGTIASAAHRWRREFELWQASGRKDAAAIESLFGDWLKEVDGIEAGAQQLQTHMRQSVTVLDRVSASLGHEMRLMRLMPVRTLLRPAMLAGRDLATDIGKLIEFTLSGETAEIDRLLVERLRDPLTHLLRNAVDHGIESPQVRLANGKSESGNIHISARSDGNAIIIEVADDGGGIDPARVAAAAIAKGICTAQEAALFSDREKTALILEPGFSTRDTVSAISGRGVGMDVVNAAIIALKGTLDIDSRPGQGTRFVMRVPGLLARERGLRVTAAGQEFVLPMNAMECTIYFHRDDLSEVDGETCVRVDGHATPVRELAAVLGLAPQNAKPTRAWHALVLASGKNRVALVVDGIGQEDEIVIKPLRKPLVSAANIKGATYDDKGGVLIVLDDAALARSAMQTTTAARAAFAEGESRRKRRILVVDDTLTTRTMETNIIEAQGYETADCANGREALDLLRSGAAFDLVVTDLEMPEMDGALLTEGIRQTHGLEHLPVIVITSRDEDEHRRRCMEAGANAYLVKSSFESSVLIETIERLL